MGHLWDIYGTSYPLPLLSYFWDKAVLLVIQSFFFSLCEISGFFQWVPLFGKELLRDVILFLRYAEIIRTLGVRSERLVVDTAYTAEDRTSDFRRWWLPPFLWALESLYLHKRLIIASCWGNWVDKVSFVAISKSAKSKPGETVQPTRENATPGAGSEANQLRAGTTYWKSSHLSICLPRWIQE